MQGRVDWLKFVVGVCLGALLTIGSGAFAADHDDTPTLKGMPRHDARVTDLDVFTREHAGPGRSAHLRRYLVLALSTNPTIPDTAATYTFPSDLQLRIMIDRHSKVDFTVDPVATATFGGTIVDPAGIDADVVFTITFDASGAPQLETTGLDEDARITLFAGLRDDPFIRAPRQGRNVASIVIELPLQQVAGGAAHRTLLVWAMSSVPGPTGPVGDLGGRALRSQFAENMPLNDYANPADHYTVLHMTPDVVIFDTRRPAAFPNGHELTDDVVDLVGDPRILATDCPVPGDPLRCNPTTNDVPFLTTFPYLAPPQASAAGNPGVTLHFGGADDQ
jgi:hypothetical protein